MEQDLFLCNVVWSLLDNIAQSFYLRNVVPWVLRQHSTRFIPVQCCLEPLAQHWTKFLPAVQCCLKSIKTTLNWIFTCAMLSQEYEDNIEQDFFLCSVVWSLLDNIAQSFYLCNIVPRVIKTTSNRLFSYAMLSWDSWATLNRIFSCAILSQEY